MLYEVITSKDLEHRGEDGLALQEARPKLKEPAMYKVVLHNDDYTPMEFVVTLRITSYNVCYTKLLRDRTLRLCKFNTAFLSGEADQGAGLYRLLMPDASRAGKWRGGCLSGDPVQTACPQAAFEQGGVVDALGHHKDIVLHVLVNDIPRLTGATVKSPDPEPLPLADGVEHQPRVFTEHTA